MKWWCVQTRWIQCGCVLIPQGRNSPENPVAERATLKNALGENTGGLRRLLESPSKLWVVGLRAVDRSGGDSEFHIT
jgi:hypothetical protein